MTDVSLSLGSNIRRYFHINQALDALEEEFGDILCSPVYESAAVGFEGSAFLNLIVCVQTDKSLSDVIGVLKRIEDENGRDRSGPKFGSRTLDIDVVTFGDEHGEIEGVELPRSELFKNAFVSLPLADVWPDKIVPGTITTYAALWDSQQGLGQQLQVVSFKRR